MMPKWFVTFFLLLSAWWGVIVDAASLAIDNGCKITPALTVSPEGMLQGTLTFEEVLRGEALAPRIADVSGLTVGHSRLLIWTRVLAVGELRMEDQFYTVDDFPVSGLIPLLRDADMSPRDELKRLDLAVQVEWVPGVFFRKPSLQVTCGNTAGLVEITLDPAMAEQTANSYPWIPPRRSMARRQSTPDLPNFVQRIYATLEYDVGTDTVSGELECNESSDGTEFDPMFIPIDPISAGHNVLSLELKSPEGVKRLDFPDFPLPICKLLNYADGKTYAGVGDLVRFWQIYYQPDPPPKEAPDVMLIQYAWGTRHDMRQGQYGILRSKKEPFPIKRMLVQQMRPMTPEEEEEFHRSQKNAK